MKIIYCQCGKKTELQKSEVKECSCGKVFGVRSTNISDYINMRKTPSGTSKIEFAQSSIGKDIAERNSK